METWEAVQPRGGRGRWERWEERKGEEGGDRSLWNLGGPGGLYTGSREEELARKEALNRDRKGGSEWLQWELLPSLGLTIPGTWATRGCAEAAMDCGGAAAPE